MWSLLIFPFTTTAIKLTCTLQLLLYFHYITTTILRPLYLTDHITTTCPLCLVGSWQAVPVFGWGEEEGFVVERESFVTKIVYIFYSVVRF